MAIKAVVWDYGGVLIRMVDETPRRELAEQLGVRLETLYRLVFESESARLASIGEITLARHWQAVGRVLKLTDAEMDAVVAKFWTADGVDAELMAFIRSLRPAYRVGLLSNAWDNLRHLLNEHWRIADAFDDLVISAEVKLQKPDPRIYHLAVERLGVRPEEAVFIDDLQTNVQGARSAGLQSVQFTTFTEVRQQLADMGIPVLS